MSDKYTPSMEEIRQLYWQYTHDPSRNSEPWDEFDRAITAHDAEVRAGMLPKGAKWFPDEGGIMWRGEVYAPVSYVMTREDIANAKREWQAEAVRDELMQVAALLEPFSGIGLANAATRNDVANWVRSAVLRSVPTEEKGQDDGEHAL